MHRLIVSVAYRSVEETVITMSSYSNEQSVNLHTDVSTITKIFSFGLHLGYLKHLVQTRFSLIPPLTYYIACTQGQFWCCCWPFYPSQKPDLTVAVCKKQKTSFVPWNLKNSHVNFLIRTECRHGRLNTEFYTPTSSYLTLQNKHDDLHMHNTLSHAYRRFSAGCKHYLARASTHTFLFFVHPSTI